MLHVVSFGESFPADEFSDLTQRLPFGFASVKTQQLIAIEAVLFFAGDQLGGQLGGHLGEAVQDADDLHLYGQRLFRVVWAGDGDFRLA